MINWSRLKVGDKIINTSSNIPSFTKGKSYTTLGIRYIYESHTYIITICNDRGYNITIWSTIWGKYFKTSNESLCESIGII